MARMSVSKWASCLLKRAGSYTSKDPTKVKGIKGDSGSADLKPGGVSSGDEGAVAAEKSSCSGSSGGGGMKTVRSVRGRGKVKRSFYDSEIFGPWVKYKLAFGQMPQMSPAIQKMMQGASAGKMNQMAPAARPKPVIPPVQNKPTPGQNLPGVQQSWMQRLLGGAAGGAAGGVGGAAARGLGRMAGGGKPSPAAAGAGGMAGAAAGAKATPPRVPQPNTMPTPGQKPTMFQPPKMPAPPQGGGMGMRDMGQQQPIPDLNIGGLQDMSPPRDFTAGGPTGDVRQMLGGGANPLSQVGQREVLTPVSGSHYRKTTQGTLGAPGPMTELGKQGAVSFGQKVAMSKVGPASVALPVKQRDQDKAKAKLRQTI